MFRLQVRKGKGSFRTIHVTGAVHWALLNIPRALLTGDVVRVVDNRGTVVVRKVA